MKWAQTVSWTRTPACVCVTVLIAAAHSDAQSAPAPPGRVNILLVTLDTTRADRLGCYGHVRPTSPNLDALASDGVRFELAVSPAAATPVSHASILTGLYPYQHGVRVIYAKSAYTLKESVPTLATLLASRGWQTGAFLSSFTVSEFYGFDRGFQVFDNGIRDAVGRVLTEDQAGRWGWRTRDNQRRSDETTNQALAWLKQTRRPFFAWVHYWDPHDSDLRPPQDVYARFLKEHGGDTHSSRTLYDIEVFYMDSQFGRIVRWLKESGRYERTVIVVVSDHGEGLGDHGWWYHRLLYQEQIRVPLILRIPRAKTGRVVRELVRTIDILPTILEVLDVPIPSRVEGRSLLGLISGRAETPRIAYADALNLFDLNAVIADRRPLDDLLYCAMDQTWKLIYRPRHPEDSELFNLPADPKELNNLYLKEPEHARRLLADLEASGGFVDRPFGRGDKAKALSRLRSLGYVGDAEEAEASKEARARRDRAGP